MYKLFNFYSQSLFSSLLTPTITLPLLLYTLLFMFNYLRLLKFTMLFYAFFFFASVLEGPSPFILMAMQTATHFYFQHQSVPYPKLFQERTKYSFLGACTDIYYRNHNFYFYIYLLRVHSLDYTLLRTRNLVLIINVYL